MILGSATPVTLVRPPPGVLRPDPVALALRIAEPIHPLHLAAMAALPLNVDLSKQPATDQGRSSACAAHALAKGDEIATGFRGSMRFIYAASGQIEGSLADEGRRLIDCLTVVSTLGVPPFGGPTPDGRNSDVWTIADCPDVPPNVSIAPSAEEIASAREHVVNLGKASIDPKAADLQTRLMASLAAGHVVYLGTQIGNAFEDLGFGVVAQPDPANDPTAGGHALLLVGYRTNADGTVDWKIQNSWGEWDEAGCCYASLAFMAATWELHPLVPQPATPPSFLERVEAELREVA